MIEFAPGRYGVEEQGVVYSLRNHSGNLRKAPMQMKQRLAKEGYMTVSLNIDGTKLLRLVHRLVAQTFIPNPLNKPEVNHKDGVKTNNVKSNLEWATESENAIHAFELGLRVPITGPNGRTNGLSKLSKPIHRLDMQGNVLETFPSMAEAQRQGYSQGNIGMVIAGIRNKHKGCRWAFA